MNYYSISKQQAFDETKSSVNGLTTQEAADRLLSSGPNSLVQAKRKSIIVKFFEQFTDIMIIVLLVAATVSAVISIVQGSYGELIDSAIILLIVIINAIIGVIQQNKAENALAALKNINKPYCRVLRDGVEKSINTEELVVGDIVFLEAGDIVPADLRLISTALLKIDESALTGESVPVEKDFDIVLDSITPLGDRKNMAFSGGSVSYGRGSGVVTATGMSTQVGKIAEMLTQKTSTTTPLQKQLGKTAKVLSFIVLGIAAIIFLAAVFSSMPIMDAFMTAVAIAVAAIPEGLPAVVTIVLAVGVTRMSKRNAIVKNLPAVETLGCCEIICSDKTGTLTLNKMTVKEIFTINENSRSDRDLLLRTMVLCNDSVYSDRRYIGDPTETALTNFAASLNMKPENIRQEWKRVGEIPFDSVRKLMTTINYNGNQKIAYIKGALDIMINRCAFIMENGQVRTITKEDKEKILEINHKLARRALRILGIAINIDSIDDPENKMVFVGLVGMMDPPRPEVKDAVRVCFRAGLRPLMITGDHADTAAAIAQEIGILRKDDKIITGIEIQKMSQEKLVSVIKQYSVFARVSPEDKVRIVKAYQSLGNVVAMTGDGVNDAPSIKQADIGVGMGITGTEVSKGAADMILTDDNFATIVNAVEEGRKIFANIKKAVQFLLSANIAEVLCLFIATLFLQTEFLTPVLILWVNLVTDSLPALSLGMERAESDVMDNPPRNAKSSLFYGKTGKDILIQGIMQTALVMLAFCLGAYVLPDRINHSVAVSMAFVSLCTIQLFHSYNLKSQDHGILNKRVFNNKWLNLSFLVGFALIVPVIMIPGLNGVFGTAPLNFLEWAIAIGCGIAIVPFVEIQKSIENALIKRSDKKQANSLTKI